MRSVIRFPHTTARRFNFIGSLVDIIGGASRSTTPASLGSNRKSPTTDQGIQAGSSSKRGVDDKKTIIKPIQPPGQRNQVRKSQSEERRNSRGTSGHDDYRNQNRQVTHRNNQQQQQGNQQQQYHQQRGGWGNRGPLRQRGRPRGAGNGGYRPNQGQPNINPAAKAKNTLKFENDYDFEQANTQFEELRTQLSKVFSYGFSFLFSYSKISF